MVSLSTERLVLREFSADDAPSVHEYASDPRVVEFMPWGPNTEEQTREFIARQLLAQQQDPRLAYELATTLKAGGHLIGACGLRLAAVEGGTGVIGYCLARRFWGQGYATEAARALLGFGFGTLDLHRISATCDVRNLASAHVLEKIGMACEGHLREDACLRGQWRDSYVYGILDREYGPEHT